MSLDNEHIVNMLLQAMALKYLDQGGKHKKRVITIQEIQRMTNNYAFRWEMMPAGSKVGVKVDSVLLELVNKTSITEDQDNAS